jgi:hypothetical protein
MTRNTTDKAASGGAPICCVISIGPTSAPRGNPGGDWLVYRLMQGENIVTGYRRGSRSKVTAEVQRIVEAFNGRLLAKGNSYRPLTRPRKPPRPQKRVSRALPVASASSFSTSR